MAKTRGSNMIESWLKQQPDSLKEEFYSVCRKNYHRKEAIHKWLLEHGLEIRSLDTVYKYVRTSVAPGDQAILFNAECENYVGVDIASAMEKILVQMIRISKVYIDKIENSTETEIPLEEAIRSLPNYVRETRTVAELLDRMTRFRDTQNLALDGAARLIEIVMNSPGIRDSADELFISRVLEAAITQLQDEIEKTPVK